MSADPIYTEMIIEYSRNPSNFGKIEKESGALSY